MPRGTSGHAKAKGALKRLNSVGKPMDLSGPALVGGKRFQISDLHDKIVIVYYWASWNSSCRNDLAKLKALRNAFESKGLELVCVNLDNHANEATQILLRTPVEAVHLYQNGGLDSPLATDYGVMVLPTTVLVGRDGKVIRRDVDVNQLEEEVKKLVK